MQKKKTHLVNTRPYEGHTFYPFFLFLSYTTEVFLVFKFNKLLYLGLYSQNYIQSVTEN